MGLGGNSFRSHNIFFHHCSESFAGGFGGTACATSGTIGLAVEVIILSISYLLGDFYPNL